MAEAVAVLSFRVHLPLELSCGMAFVGTPNLLLPKVSWRRLTYCLMYFKLILADLLLKKIRDTCTSLSASSALMAVPSSRKTVMSKTSSDAFTKVMLNKSTDQLRAHCLHGQGVVEKNVDFFLLIPKLEM